jgi:hypothetical protein
MVLIDYFASKVDRIVKIVDVTLGYIRSGWGRVD